MEEDREPLLSQPELQVQYGGVVSVEASSGHDEPRTHVYKRRWYVLLVFCSLAFVQSNVWNTWGPIANSVELALGWSTGQLALMPNYGIFAFLPTVFIFSYLLDVKGLRWGVVTCALLVGAGAALRCISIDSPYGFALESVGAFVSGLGGPVCLTTPPVISSTWFPPAERTSATSMAIMGGYFGVAASFLLGPYMVRSVSVPPTPMTSFDNTSALMYNVTDLHIQEIKSDIRRLLYIEAGVTAVIVIMILAYFPAAPALPPSITAAEQRQSYVRGIKGLLKSEGFWCIGLSYGISSGVYNVWNSELTVILSPHGISQETCGWLGFYTQLGGVVAAIVGSRIADKFSGHLKVIILTMATISLASSIWLVLIIADVLPNNAPSIYASFIGGGVFLAACIPLWYELAIETAFPIGEGITAGLMTWLANFFGMIFLFGLEIPGIGTMWTNYAMAGGIALVIPLMLIYRETYNRLSVDTHGDVTHADKYSVSL